MEASYWLKDDLMILFGISHGYMLFSDGVDFFLPHVVHYLTLVWWHMMMIWLSAPIWMIVRHILAFFLGALADLYTWHVFGCPHELTPGRGQLTFVDFLMLLNHLWGGYSSWTLFYIGFLTHIDELVGVDNGLTDHWIFYIIRHGHSITWDHMWVRGTLTWSFDLGPLALTFYHYWHMDQPLRPPFHHGLISSLEICDTSVDDSPLFFFLSWIDLALSWWICIVFHLVIIYVDLSCYFWHYLSLVSWEILLLYELSTPI